MNLTTQVHRLRTSARWQSGIRHAISYSVLLAGAAFMLFPMLWMILASLKPVWQIFAIPPTWIPQEWEQVEAGQTNRMLSLWKADVEGQTVQVVQLGTRRYTTVVPPEALANLTAAPRDQLSEAAPTQVGDATFNVRTWNAEGGARQVVAVARGENDTLLVADVADLEGAAYELPLDEVNAGKRVNVAAGEVELQGRELEIDGAPATVIPIGPEHELSVVGSPEVAGPAFLVTPDMLGESEFVPVGHTELKLYALEDDDSGARYVLLSQEPWQPVLDVEIVRAHAFTVPAAQLAGERETIMFNDIIAMTVDTYTPPEGEPRQVVILIAGTEQSLVIEPENVTGLRLAPFHVLIEPAVERIDNTVVRVQTNYLEHGETRAVVPVGDGRDMALVSPQTAIKDAFDVPPDALERVTHVRFRVETYTETVNMSLGEASFLTFFQNSFIVVILNIIGHVLSCTLVAYAFARFNAPGKNVLFVILLGTMMIPYPIVFIPTYEIFRDLNMINTLWPLFIRSFFGNSFLIFLLRQFFMAIPSELEDAARIDGASTWQVLWHIIAPLSKPALATVVIFTFWWNWNSFLEPFVFLNSAEKYTVAVGLNYFRDQYVTIHYDRVMAASTLAMLPTLLLFFVAQRYFIEGIQLSGLKG